MLRVPFVELPDKTVSARHAAYASGVKHDVYVRDKASGGHWTSNVLLHLDVVCSVLIYFVYCFCGLAPAMLQYRTFILRSPSYIPVDAAAGKEVAITTHGKIVLGFNPFDGRRCGLCDVVLSVVSD